MATEKKRAVDFETGLLALSQIVDKLEGDLPLEEAMAAYEEGVKLHKTLSKALDASEKKLKILSASEEDA